MRNWLKTAYSIAAIVSLLGVTSSVHGVAAFARQTGLDCSSCHASTGYPTLNAFGRAFKAGAYTQANEDNLMGDGEALSIPANMNFGVVFKGKGKITFHDDGTDSNEWAVPDETALFSAGRIAKDVGYAIELNDAWWNSFKVVYAPQLGPVRLGVTLWATDGFSPAWSFEELNTGAVRNNRIVENRKLVSAVNYLGFGGADETAGVGLYVWHPMGYVTYTPFTTYEGGQDIEGMGSYVRIAATPSFGMVDLGVGFAYTLGTNRYVDEFGAKHETSYNFLSADLQAYLDVGLPLAFVVTYANDLEATASALTVVADAAVVPDMFNITLAFRTDLENSTNAIGGDFRYQIYRNFRVALGWELDLDTNDFTLEPMVFGSW